MLVHPRRDADHQAAVLAHAALAPAGGAGRADDHALPAAILAGHYADQLAEDRVLNAPHLAAAVANRAALRLALGGGPAAPARLAQHQARNPNLFFHAED